jgi:16S rRNA (cytosine1402-N4)-methyltransferase
MSRCWWTGQLGLASLTQPWLTDGPFENIRLADLVLARYGTVCYTGPGWTPGLVFLQVMISHPPRHLPVLPEKVLEFLAPQPGQIIVDCTMGGGGHSQLIAQRLSSQGRLLGLDQDEEMLKLAKERLRGLPVQLFHANFDQLRPLLIQLNLRSVDGILADLGFCSEQLNDAQRGFSFMQEGPLDMRLDRSVGEPASKLLERLSERDLADVFWRFGEERFSRRIARRIVQERQRKKLQTTAELADLVRRCVPRSRGQAIDPATRVFQALRIAINDELGSLERLLSGLPDCLRPGGRAVIISFHSLEDRLVKRSFRQRDTWQELTRKPVQATEAETRNNPRARSAKLRAAVRKAPEQEERAGT